MAQQTVIHWKVKHLPVVSLWGIYFFFLFDFTALPVMKRFSSNEMVWQIWIRSTNTSGSLYFFVLLVFDRFETSRDAWIEFIFI